MFLRCVADYDDQRSCLCAKLTLRADFQLDLRPTKRVGTTFLNNTVYGGEYIHWQYTLKNDSVIYYYLLFSILIGKTTLIFISFYFLLICNGTAF